MSKAIRVQDFPSIPMAIKTLDRLEAEIKHAPTLEHLEDAADTSAAIQRKFHRVKSVSDRAGEVWIASDRKLSAELAKMPKAKGTRGQGRPTLGGPKVEPPKDAPTLAELKVSKKWAARAHRIGELSDSKLKSLIAELKAADKAITPNAVLVKVRQNAKVEKQQQLLTATFSEDGPFDVVVIDPPWKVEKIDREERPNQDAFDYPVMTVNEIIAFWKLEMAHRLCDDTHLFLWTTQKHLPAALDLIGQIGFRYVLLMVWHKPGGFQPVGLPQYNCEFIVYARKGAPLFVETKQFDCCFSAPRREHSRKPDCFYDLVRRVTAGSRVDVFSREKREGFAQYGNETGKFAATTEAAE